MCLAVERQHVVLAHGEEIDVFNDDHLVIFLFEQRIGQHLVRVHGVASCEHLHGFGHTHGGLHKTFAFWVFANEFKHFVVVGCQFIKPFSVFCFWIHYL